MFDLLGAYKINSNSLQKMKFMDKRNIKIDQIRNEIPNNLYDKLCKFNINTIDDLLMINIQDFAKQKSVGAKAIFELKKLLNKINELSVETNSLSFDYILDDNLPDELLVIKISDIEELLNKRLYIKFQKNNIEHLRALTKLQIQDFAALPGVGANCINLLRDFIFDLKSNSNKYISCAHKKVIPSTFDGSKMFFHNFITFVDELILLRKNKGDRNSDCLKKYYGIESDRYTFDEIGTYYEISRERVRQIVHNEIIFLRKMLQGLNNEFNIRCNVDLIANAHRLSSIFSNQKIIPRFFLEEYAGISERYLEGSREIAYVELFIDIFKLEYLNIAFSDEIYLYDFLYSKDIVLLTFKTIYNVLSISFQPIDDFKLRVEVTKMSGKLPGDLILKCIDVLSEVEKIKKGDGSSSFRLRFDKLSSYSDMVIRILSEKNKILNISEIVAEINHRLFHANIKKRVTRDVVVRQLSECKYVTRLGKTGNYSLTEWSGNSSTIEEIIKNAFLSSNTPLTHKEIITYVKKERGGLNEDSIRTITNKYFLRIEDNRYILPEWKLKYKSLLYSKKEKSIPQYMLAVNELKKSPNGQMKKKDLKKILIEKYNFSNESAFSVLGRKDRFDCFIDTSGHKMISIKKENKVKTLASDKVRSKAIEILNSTTSKSMCLSDLVKKLIYLDKKFNRAYVYKVLNLSYDLFEKINLNNTVLIKLVEGNTESRKNSILDVDIIIDELTHELTEFFTDLRQPHFDITLREAIVFFVEVVKLRTGEASLDGLHEMLFRTIIKYYQGQNDQTDLFLQLKQVSLSLDPFAKKVLFLVDYEKYKIVQSKKQGLGTILGLLPKIDPSDNRYKKSIDDVPDNNFARHLYIAYNTRNSLAHEAKKWPKQQVISSFTSTLVLFVYITIQYSSQIEERVIKK